MFAARLPACQHSADRTLQCVLCPGGAGWVAEQGQRERREERGERREEGRTGRVRSEVATDRSWNTRIPSIQLESCSLLHAGRIWRGEAPGPERAPTKQRATEADVASGFSERKKREGRERNHNTATRISVTALSLSLSLSLTLSPTRSTLNLFV